jgi:uncharacterized protein (TIGR00369 family)
MTHAKEIIQKVFGRPDHFGELLGYQVESHGDGQVRTSLVIEEKHLSPSGMTHGGVLSAMADFSMGVSLFTRLKEGQRCSTIEFKINYLSPVKLGEKVYCDGRLKFMGRSHAVIEFHLFREEGKDIAMGIGTYNVY